MTDADIWGLSPTEAAARLEMMKMAPPATGLAARLENDEWRQALLAGNGPHVKEFNDLLQKKAEADDRLDKIVAGTAEVPFMETVTGGQITTRNAIQAAEDLRGFGLNDESIKQAIAGTPVSRAEYDAVKILRGDLMADKEWSAKLLAGDPAATREFTLMNTIVANGYVAEKAT
jgi:hypothetical protein